MAKKAEARAGGAAKRVRALPAVKSVLERYAQRGVFRSLSETAGAAGIAEFRFHWLWNLPFRLLFEEQRRTITFDKLLPDTQAGSAVREGLNDFLADYLSTERPEHRRFDKNRVAVRFTTRRGVTSLTFTMASDYAYGTERAIHFVNELFITFLNLHYPQYMVKNFRLSEE